MLQTSSLKQTDMADAETLFGIYVHWPFCLSKCPYCDFNSHVREQIDHSDWAKALCKELDYYAALTKNRTVSSIFFGGGTPSLMEPDTVQHIIDRVAYHWETAPDIEITLEANPTSVESGKFQDFATAGVNRVSVGIQSFDDRSLTFLGRQHSADEAKQAIAIAQRHFDRYSFDLIYARPEQTPEQWTQELSKALTLTNGHLSLYQLTIERGTQFFTQHARGDFAIPNDDNAGDLYDLTQDIMDKANLPAYEISNHATAGQESRHNLTYWRYHDYVGIGPGAHGRLTLDDGQKIATRTHRAPEIWLEKVNDTGHAGHEPEHISDEMRFQEMLMMGLRLNDGIGLNDIKTETQHPLSHWIDQHRLTHMTEAGFLKIDDNIIKTTKSGRVRLNALLSYLLS